jgi:hypothetical protein
MTLFEPYWSMLQAYLLLHLLLLLLLLLLKSLVVETMFTIK